MQGIYLWKAMLFHNNAQPCQENSAIAHCSPIPHTNTPELDNYLIVSQQFESLLQIFPTVDSNRLMRLNNWRYRDFFQTKFYRVRPLFHIRHS